MCDNSRLLRSPRYTLRWARAASPVRAAMGPAATRRPLSRMQKLAGDGAGEGECLLDQEDGEALLPG
jgi:hypothetical protein